MKPTELAPLWKALADGKRRHIIQLLGEQARTTSEISSYFDVSRFAVMRHLKVLEQSGLIRTRREGRQRWNFLNEALFQQIQEEYLDGDGDGEFHLAEVLHFLARQDSVRPDGSAPATPTIELEVDLAAEPVQVFRALTEEIDAWWSYRVAADSTIWLEAVPGGRFYEAFAGGGGALYARVTYVRPGEALRFKGTMGLPDDACTNLIQMRLAPRAAGETRLTLVHRFPGNVSAITVETFERSWKELLCQHFKGYVEQGKHCEPAQKQRAIAV
jgi:DNA-binding transcriptional ArsR family regulator/uncharacterized protein YndB with AHSA1/START domain